MFQLLSIPTIVIHLIVEYSLHLLSNLVDSLYHLLSDFIDSPYYLAESRSDIPTKFLDKDQRTQCKLRP